MGWSGGTFTRVHDWTVDAAAGVDILASRMDQEDDNFAAGINECINKGGQNAATADLPMNSFRHKDVGEAQSRTHYATAGGVQDGGYSWGGTSTGNANAHVLTGVGGEVGFPTSYPTGSKVFYIVGFGPNTSAVSLSVNGGPAKQVVLNGQTLADGALVAGQLMGVVYDGIQWQMLGGAGSSSVAFMPISVRAQATITRPKNAGTTTMILFDAEQWDDAAFIGTMPTSSFTIPQTGRYLVMCRVVPDPSAAVPEQYALRLTLNLNGNLLDGTQSTFATSLDVDALLAEVKGEVFVCHEQEFAQNDIIQFAFFWKYIPENGGFTWQVYGTPSIGYGTWALIRRTG